MDINVMFLLSVLWTVIGGVGVAFTFLESLECRKDLLAVRRASTYLSGGDKEIVAKQNRRLMQGRLIMLVVFTGVGVLAVFTPSSGRPITALGLFTRLAFIAAELYTSSSSIFDRRDRASLLRHTRERRSDRASWGRSGDSGRLERENT